MLLCLSHSTTVFSIIVELYGLNSVLVSLVSVDQFVKDKLASFS